MIAFKGFTRELRSRLGDGREENCSFHAGETKEVPSSKTAREGFHCCENPFECLGYYPLHDSRFFMVDASGDIDEDGSERIACTKITILEELTPVRFAMEGMKYMILHPQRDSWQQSYEGVTAAPETAEAKSPGDIAIARGTAPRVRGPKESILGILVEEKGEIKGCKLKVIGDDLADRWLRLTDNRELEEAADEEKED